MAFWTIVNEISQQRRFMFWNNSKSVVAASSAIMVVLMVLLTVVGLSRLKDINNRIEQLAHTHTTKTKFLHTLRSIVRERSLAMYAIYVAQDPFLRDEEYMRFRALATEFIAVRERLEALGLSAREKEALKVALTLIQKSEPLQNHIVEEMLDGRPGAVFNLMSSADLPLEREILAVFENLVTIEQQQTDLAFAEAGSEYHRAYFFLLMAGAAVASFSILVSFFVVRRIAATEGALFEEKEKAQVTLAAIGDGVITTDAGGLVTYLNPVAETLTGWSATQALGQPLTDIYTVVHDKTSRPLMESTHGANGSSIHRHVILHSRDTSHYDVEDSAAPIRDHAGEKIGTVIVFRDVTHERVLSQQLAWQARHDSLTGLANRREFERVLQRLLENAGQDQQCHALLYFDLDQFKLVNDTSGHIAGDELLKQLSLLLKSALRKGDLLARLGGDEFGVVLEDCTPENASIVANHLLTVVKDFRFVWEQKTFAVGASIGLVSINDNNRDINQILSAADTACYLAKDKGRNCVYVHNSDDTELSSRQNEMDWATRLTEAIEQDRFELFVQKVQPTAPHARLDYCELLLRLKGNDGKLVSPMAFIPAAERFGLMTEIDKWTVRFMLRWLKHRGAAATANTIYALNLSGQSVSSEAFRKFVMDEYRAYEGPPARICLEITETAAISNWRHASQFIFDMKAMGVMFALDDFGSGMSSFAYLKNLPVDFLKIDGTFVRDILVDRIDRAMVNAINQIGHEMGITTIAEFVENAEVLSCITELGVDYAQGYGIHVPAALETVFPSYPRQRAV